MVYIKARFAGMFYEKSKEALLKQLENCFFHEYGPKDEKSLNAKAVIVPHAGYIYSGPAMAHAYRALGKIDKAIIFGTNHSAKGTEPFILPNKLKGYELPNGKIEIEKIDLDISAERNDEIIANEHSIEVQLPFIKYLNENAKIFPIIVNTFNLEEISYLIDKILEANNGFKFIFSSDFTHYGIQYGFAPFEAQGKKLIEKIHLLDKACIEKIFSLNATEFEKEARKTTICGVNVIMASIELAKKLNLKPILLKYYTSAEITKSYDNFAIVSYASIAFR